MKVLFAIALVAACGVAEAKPKAAPAARAAPLPAAQMEATDASPKNALPVDAAPARSPASKVYGESSRDPYNVPLFRDARTMR